MLQDYIRICMNNHIELLFKHFNEYVDKCVKNKLLSNFNRESISIDFSSNSRKGDISSNFYLVARIVFYFELASFFSLSFLLKLLLTYRFFLQKDTDC